MNHATITITIDLAKPSYDEEAMTTLLCKISNHEILEQLDAIVESVPTEWEDWKIKLSLEQETRNV